MTYGDEVVAAVLLRALLSLDPDVLQWVTHSQGDVEQGAPAAHAAPNPKRLPFALCPLAARLGPPEGARAAPPRAPSSGSAPDRGPGKKCAVRSGSHQKP